MSLSQYRIDAFEELPGIVEIVAFGRVLRQPGSTLEAEIEILLASRLDGPRFDPENDVHVRRVGCGQFDLLTMGSRWRGGERIGESQADRVNAVFSLIGFEMLGSGATSPADRRPHPTGRMAAAPCFLLGRVGAEERDGLGPAKVLLPAMELVRALFGVSSRFVLGLIDGVRHPAVPDIPLDAHHDASLMRRASSRRTCRSMPFRAASGVRPRPWPPYPLSVALYG